MRKRGSVRNVSLGELLWVVVSCVENEQNTRGKGFI